MERHEKRKGGRKGARNSGVDAKRAVSRFDGEILEPH